MDQESAPSGTHIACWVTLRGRGRASEAGQKWEDQGRAGSRGQY